jgi:cytochrome P450
MAVTDNLASNGPAIRRVRDLPGPRGLPLLGNALQIDRDRIHQQTEQWARQYGEAYRFRIASREFVVLSNPETVATILRDRPDGFQRTERLNETARAFGFDGLFSSNGEAWKRQRPMVLSGLDPTHIKAFFPMLAKVTQCLARRWGQAALAGRPIDLQSDLMRYTVDVTAGLGGFCLLDSSDTLKKKFRPGLGAGMPPLPSYRRWSNVHARGDHIAYPVPRRHSDS